LWISGAKFEQHCFYISKIFFIQYFTIYKLQTSWPHNFPHFPNTNTLISLQRKEIFQKRKPHSYLFLKSLSNKQLLFFISKTLKSIISCLNFWDKSLQLVSQNACLSTSKQTCDLLLKTLTNPFRVTSCRD